MALTLNGSNNTIAGLAVGGLPDGIVDAGTLASNSVETAKIAAEAVTNVKQGPGSVVQFIQGTPNNINNRSSSNSNSSITSTGNYIQITPTNSSNLIVVGGFFTTYVDTSGRGIEFYIHNSNLSSVDANQQSGMYFHDANPWFTCPIKYSCTAGTTSQITFTLYIQRYGNTSGNAYVGWGSSTASSHKNWHDMWAMEVVA